MSTDGPDYYDEVMNPSPPSVRFKMFRYKHTHECPWKDQEFQYRPATQGAVMFPITPRCVEANVELKLIEVVDE